MSGLLAEPENAEDFADKLSRLIDDPGLRIRLDENAMEVVKRFSFEKTVEKNIHLYSRIF